MQITNERKEEGKGRFKNEHDDIEESLSEEEVLEENLVPVPVPGLLFEILNTL